MNNIELKSKSNLGKKFTEVIGDDYKTWKKGNIILLNGATGSGKTYFIIYRLGSYCVSHFKTILFLCNRAELRQDVQLEIEKENLQGIISVMTYQAYQNKVNEGDNINLTYDYIVYDECHYFTSEGWNCNTDRIFELFNNTTDKVCSILMSGTGHNIFTYMRTKTIITKEYIIPYDYSYVEKIIFYEKDDVVERVFNNLKENEKAIFFSRKLDTAFELYDKYKERAHFKCSEYCDYKNFNEDCIQVYDKDLITFEKQILIATVALDVGVTIKDKKIKYIITDLLNLNQLQQCLGRKRVIDEEDTCIFYIKSHDNRTLNGFIRTVENNVLSDAREYEHNREQFIEKANIKRRLQDNPCFQYQKNEVTDTRKGTNSIMGSYQFNYFTYAYYYICQTQMEHCKEKGFANVVMENLNKIVITIPSEKIEYQEATEEEKRKDELELYLEKLVGKELLKEQRNELINKIGLKDSWGRIQKSIGLLNAYIEENRLPYIIKSERKSIREGQRVKKINYWLIYKLIDEIVDENLQ